jgi:hypothetical protein
VECVERLDASLLPRPAGTLGENLKDVFRRASDGSDPWRDMDCSWIKVDVDRGDAAEIGNGSVS